MLICYQTSICIGRINLYLSLIFQNSNTICKLCHYPGKLLIKYFCFEEKGVLFHDSEMKDFQRKVNYKHLFFSVLSSVNVKKYCEWTAQDFSTDEAVRRTFRAQFCSETVVDEFVVTFQEV